MAPSLRDALRAFSPVVATATVLTTLIVCVVITKTRHVYVGGLKWPYFSDMGRDPPAYYVFIAGLSLVAVTLAITWLFNGEFQRNVAVSRGVQRASSTATALAVVSVIGLPVLAICDTSSFPSVHNAAAYAFFLLQTIAVTINTVVSQRIYAAAKRVQTSGHVVLTDTDDDRIRDRQSVARTFYVQLGMWLLFFVAFLIYLPIGLSIIKPFKHLTIDECIARNLGKTYCEEDMNYDTTETKLWNYEDDFAANQMRSAAQLACILTLVGYTLTFKTHNYASITKNGAVVDA